MYQGASERERKAAVDEFGGKETFTQGLLSKQWAEPIGPYCGVTAACGGVLAALVGMMNHVLRATLSQGYIASSTKLGPMRRGDNAPTEGIQDDGQVQEALSEAARALAK